MRFTIDDLTKRPNIYFLITLTASIVWVVVISAVMYPSAGKQLDKAVTLSKEISGYCEEIFQLDPARLNYSQIRKDIGQFSYTTAVDKTAGKFGIKAADYDIRTEQVRNYRGSKTQGATMTISQVSISKFAGFLSELLEIWPDLKCDNMKLTAIKDKPDNWKITIKFTYNIQSSNE